MMMGHRTVADGDAEHGAAADGDGVAAVGHQMDCSYGIEVAFGD